MSCQGNERRNERRLACLVHAEIMSDAVLPSFAVARLGLVRVIAKPLIQLLQRHSVGGVALDGPPDELRVRLIRLGGAGCCYDAAALPSTGSFVAAYRGAFLVGLRLRRRAGLAGVRGGGRGARAAGGGGRPGGRGAGGR